MTLTVADDDGGVGRSAAVSVTVLSAEQAVAGVAEELRRIVEDGQELGENQAAGLVSKLERAAAAAAGGGDEKAVVMLEAFKHQVLGFVAAGKLTHEAGGLLVEEADEIIEWIRGS